MSKMICPRAKECTVVHCYHCDKKPHEYDAEGCTIEALVCPACIPYIPEQPKEPKSMSKKFYVRSRSNDFTLEQPKKPATHAGSARWWDETPADLKPAEPEMPLREQFHRVLSRMDKPTWGGGISWNEALNWMVLIIEAHDSAVVKEFADTLKWIAEHLTHIRISPIGDSMDIDYIDNEGHTQSYTYNDSECKETYQEMLMKAVAHIRAMAEGKE